MASLQDCVREKIFKELIYPHRGKGEATANGGPGQPYKESQWKVLVLDSLATRMISACCKMHQIMAEGITLVEKLSMTREPLPQLDAIYLITPTSNSINQMLADFAEHNKWTYRAAHVYFTEACPDELFKEMCRHPATKYKAIKTLKEINCAFLPYERKVFTLDNPGMFKAFYYPSLDRVAKLEQAAEKIATLCATLGEFPSIRYRSQFDNNHEFAQLLHQKLVAYKADDPRMGDGTNKERSQLIILDRGFDPISLFVHELTFQAMAYDLLPIKDDVYGYTKQTPTGNKEAEVILDESDILWVDMRHRHIADVSQKVTQGLRKFADEKRIGSKDQASVKDVAQMVKQMPQYQKELNNYATHMHLAEDCMKEYQAKISNLCKVEQDLAMGTDPQNERIRDPMRAIVPILLDQNISVDEKIRVIHLYILHKGGLSDENLSKLMQHGNIPAEHKMKIFNVQHMGVTVIAESSSSVNVNDSLAMVPLERNRRSPYNSYQALNRRERISEQTFQQSRWTPYLKDLLEDACEDKLDQKQFPYLGGGARGGRGAAPASARPQYNWSSGRTQTRSGPRLIFFVIGGITYSETRVAYEVAANNKDWDIIVGSTHIITPKDHLSDLQSLSETDSPGADVQPPPM
ncbi:syntaxin-binding protein 1-like isoform X2 [Watersipora subatra]|uniref:syntaxin-binding protein 1-like isoform X2 n=1 Tax=Watersipora subatra TaxID=2589382 RepID=UPI00355BD0B5